MPRGGFRPGAGRPPKVQFPDLGPHATPIEFLLAVMRHEGADLTTRMRAASALLPFVHARRTEMVSGKKEQAQIAAQTAGDDTDWGDDLMFHGNRVSN
jgi:hypothetical protein